MKQTLDEKKAVLLDGLRQVRGDIQAAALEFSPGEENIPFVGVWSLLELLAHLAGWDVTNRQAAREVLSGTVPSFYSYISKDWAEYNASLVSQHRKESLEEMLAEVSRTHLELLEDLEALTAQDLFADHGVRRGSYRVIISRLLEAERKDEARHLQQILEVIQQRRK
jgi:DinB superfamily